MALQHLEAWCIRLLPGLDADHTFVIPRLADWDRKILACWGVDNSMTIADRCFLTAVSAESVYDMADRLRFPGPRPLDRRISDTAGIGVYGVNGVCHQTSNLYLSLGGTDHFIKAVLHGGSVRPRGYAASCLLFGLFGRFKMDAQVRGPDGSWITFYEWWYRNVARPRNPGLPVTPRRDAEAAADLGAPPAPSLIETLADVQRASQREGLSPERALAREIAETMRRTGAAELALFEDTHARLLAEHQNQLAAEWDGNPVIGERLAHRINEIGVQMQRELRAVIGPVRYSALNGCAADEEVQILDSRIAAGAPPAQEVRQ